MADPAGWIGRPSLRRRSMIAFGIVTVIGAVALRLSYYRTTVDALARDVDVQLWSRLAVVQAREVFAPGAPDGPGLRSERNFLPDFPAGTTRPAPRILGLPVPALEPSIDAGSFAWFTGVWNRDGTLVDDRDLPAGIAWDPAWTGRLDTLWTTADGRHRLAATAGARDTVIVVGTPLDALAADARQVGRFQVFTFFFWVPLLLGVVWLALSRSLVPLRQIAATAHRIRGGRFEERVDAARADTEFAELAGTLNDMLDRLDEIRLSQSRFNADVAHQFMNPVHAILLESDAAAAAPRSAEDLRSSLDRVGGLARRIESICGSLLAYARTAAIDPGRLQPVDLEPVVAAACDRVADHAGGRGVAVVPPAAGIVVRGDPTLLEEVFVNLLVNAVEHSPAGGRVEIALGSDASGSRATVTDHGHGVPADVLPELFTRYRSGKAGGHGVGLALSRRILRSHGGDLWHEPTPGGGATFTLLFPGPDTDHT